MAPHQRFEFGIVQILADDNWIATQLGAMYEQHSLRDYVKLTKRLLDVLPNNVVWLSNKQLQDLLSISSPTRRRDAVILKALKLLPEKRKDRDGYDLKTLVIWWEFRQLHSLTSRYFAITNICRLLEIIYDESDRQTSSSRCNEPAA
ncbi:hypothetical protein [Lyngbya sp. PCC 8106]|uniref:hypothetical protein n=1 Tax=Lyngbya sp. (strain PCC 8106) TaxID=313612 RepID=UPI0000EAB646|nr:hypothetical protein [Lyngbya sp. PCC 8106]EAW35980.1 hypothetical protein L8106_22331 [Lyngbya sp. PCC 8106]